MPNLLNFLEDKGALFTNHHTPLISHTAVDIVTSLTGVYGDKFGVPIGNSFGLFGPNGVTFPQLIHLLDRCLVRWAAGDAR